MTNPWEQIEERKGQTDLGVFAYRIYEGARSEGASRRDALYVVAAWFFSMFKQNDDDTEGSEAEE